MFSDNTWHVERAWILVIVLFCVSISILLIYYKKNIFTFNLIHYNKLFHRSVIYKALVFFSYIFVLLSFILLGLASSGVSRITKENILQNKERNILLLLDTSPSMSAEDIDGKSRWDALLQSVDFLLDNAHSEKIGVMLFAKNISFHIPFTQDYAFIKEKMHGVYLGALGNETAVADALMAAYNIYAGVNKNTDIIVITDGNQNTGNFKLKDAEPYISEISPHIIFVQIGGDTKANFTYIDYSTEKVISGTLLPTNNNFILNFIKNLSILYYEVDSNFMLTSIMSGVLKVEPQDLYIVEKTDKLDYTNILIIYALICYLSFWILRHIFLGILW